jgi:hypothetical protein
VLNQLAQTGMRAFPWGFFEVRLMRRIRNEPVIAASADLRRHYDAISHLLMGWETLLRSNGVANLRRNSRCFGSSHLTSERRKGWRRSWKTVFVSEMLSFIFFWAYGKKYSGPPQIESDHYSAISLC